MRTTARGHGLLKLLRRCLLSVIACCSASAAADELPAISSIEFEGNATTRPRVMLRESLVHVGDPADPARIEESRQAIQDLGLFRSVSARELPDGKGGVRVIFVVAEKWYILPVPRIGYDSDKKLNYGGQLTWYNIAGLNQTLRINWVHGNPPQAGAAGGQNLNLSYDMPVLDDSPWALNFSGGHSRAPFTTPTVYDSVSDNVQVLATRKLDTMGPFSKGWMAGGGLLWQNERNQGTGAPVPQGEATALVGVAGYRDIHDLIYSTVGTQFSLRGELAIKDWASNYGYELISANWRRNLAVGDTPFQNLNFVFDGGARFDGPASGSAFALGGRSSLHGYSSGAVEGNSYYHVGIEYLHPVYWNWLRGLVVLDAGNAFDSAGEPQLTRVRTSIGVGLRARVSWLVNFEIEAGVAMPMDRLDKPRFFGGRIDETR